IIRLNNFDFDIVLQKLNDGHYRAMELKCTHAGHPLTKSGSGYYCTLHGSVFSEDGRVLKGPASEPMLHFKTAVENNQILIYLIYISIQISMKKHTLTAIFMNLFITAAMVGCTKDKSEPNQNIDELKVKVVNDFGEKLAVPLYNEFENSAANLKTLV